MSFLARIFPKYHIRGLSTLAPLGIYLLLSLFFLGRNVDWTAYYFGYSTDSVLFIWFLHWWPFALSHGLNPFICKYVWFPTGYNIAWATSIPFFALLAWPVTMLVSPVLSYNILMLSAPALAGWTAFLLGRELTGNWAAALVCGLLFGFSGPEMSQVLAQLNLDSIFLVPLSVWLCLRRWRGSMRRLPFIISLSFVLAAQLGISTEILATLCLTGGLGWVSFLLAAPAAARPAFWRLAVDVAICTPLVLLLTAPFIYYLLRGLPEIPADIHGGLFQQTDLLLFVFPSLPAASAHAWLASLAAPFSGYMPGNFTYLGLPLLLLLGIFFYRYRRVAYARALMGMICVTALLCLGLRLEVDGRATMIPLPWLLLTHVPIIRSIIPARFAIELTLAGAIAVGFVLAGARTITARMVCYGLAALACLCLPPARVQVLPAQWNVQPLFQPQDEFKWSRWPVQPFFTAAHIRQALGPMPNVLLVPAPFAGPGMAWQINAGMSFTQAEGYVGFNHGGDLKWTALDDSARGQLDADFAQSFSVFCAAHMVDYVLIGPGTADAVVHAIEALGWPHHMDNGIEVVKVPL